MNKGPRGGVFQQPKDRRKVILRLWKYLYQFKWRLFLALLLTVASNLLALLGPFLSGLALDAIGTEAGKVHFHDVFLYCGLMAGFYVFSALLGYVLSVVMIRLSQQVTFRMRRDLFNRLLELPVSFFDRHQVGDIISRLSYDIDTVNASLSTDLLQVATSVITVGGSLAMMLAISPLLVLIFAVTIPISVVTTKYMTGRTKPLFSKRSQKLGELNGFVEEIITGQKTIKAYHQEESFTGRFDEKNQEAVEAYYRADYYGTMVGPSINFINNLSLSMISVAGALLYVAGGLTLGNLSSFVLYSRKFSGPINEMANILNELQSAAAAAERVFRMIDEPAEAADAPDAKALISARGNVEIRNVRFGYDPDKPIIHDLSLAAEQGSLVAIVGPTGAGKTTIINLLMRFYDPQSGMITLDGQSIQCFTRSSLRLNFAMVLQDTWLFQGTVFENIAYGKEGATLEEVEQAAKAARIHEYIQALPDGYDTVLAGEGTNISQGQKQLMTIARAMLLGAHLLILDEATSNVDTRTEIQIQEAMRKLMRGKTSFVIAHRLSTIQNADTILVVNNGDVVEQGDHKTLMQKGGMYATLYLSQFQ